MKMLIKIWRHISRAVIPVLLSLSAALLFNLLSPAMGTPGSLVDAWNSAPSCVSVALGAPLPAPQIDKTTWLCGKLIFLVDGEGKNYLGLQPCPGSLKPVMIFKIRPRELWTYYQFKNPVIKKGPQVPTNRGPVNYYIETFASYIPLNDCSECLANLQGTPAGGAGAATETPVDQFVFPTAGSSTPTLTPAATLTPTPTPTTTPTASATPLPTATDTAIPSATVATPPQPATTPSKPKALCPSAPLALLLPLSALLLRRRLFATRIL